MKNNEYQKSLYDGPSNSQNKIKGNFQDSRGFVNQTNGSEWHDFAHFGPDQASYHRLAEAACMPKSFLG